jgi:hypothetical protein
MHGSTENQRDDQAQAAGQIGAAIHPQTGDIVIIHAGRPLFGMSPSDAAAFASGLCQIIANHPQLKAPVEPVPQLVIAGSVPPFARH